MEILGQLQHFSAPQKTKRQLPPFLEGAQGTWPSASTTGTHVRSQPEAWQYFTALGNGTFVQWLKTEDLSLEPQWHTGLIHSKLPT